MIKYKDCSFTIKAAIWFAWISGMIIVAQFMLGFIIGITG